MYRGTTPTHVFGFSVDRDDISKLQIVYTQDGMNMPFGTSRANVVLKLDETDVEWTELTSGCVASYMLSQSETSNFVAGIPVKVQARVKLAPETTGDDPTVTCSQIFTLSVEDVLDDEEL